MILFAGIDATSYNNIFNDLCKKFNIIVNFNKDKIHIINDFLKIELNTLLMKTRFSQKKLFKAIELIKTVLKKKFISMKNLQSLVDFFAFAFKVVISNRAFLKRLYNALNAEYFKIRMTSAMKKDFRWWSKFLLT